MMTFVLISELWIFLEKDLKQLKKKMEIRIRIEIEKKCGNVLSSCLE